MSTIGLEEKVAIAEFLFRVELGKGVGTRDTPCSIAAINLALSGRLTDDVPECMSPTLGKWVMYVQDAMPSNFRNSLWWKDVLPDAAGTGIGKEVQRAGMIAAWCHSAAKDALECIETILREFSPADTGLALVASFWIDNLALLASDAAAAVQMFRGNSSDSWEHVSGIRDIVRRAEETLDASKALRDRSDYVWETSDLECHPIYYWTSVDPLQALSDLIAA